MPAPGVDAAHEPSDARADVVAEGDSAQQGLARGVLPFGHGQRGGDDGAAGVGERRRVRVVCLVRVGEHTVGHGGVDGSGDDVRADDSGLGDASLRTDEVDGGLTRLEAGASDHGRDGVEDMVLRLLQDGGRKRAVESGCDVGREGVERGLLGHEVSSLSVTGVSRRR